jgi:shikimate dehydrogenase
MTPPKIYGLIGYPVKHSLSPYMHNAAFKALGINAEYKLFEKRPEELGYFLHSLSKENIYGLNVTIPYKEVVLKYLQWKSPEVKFTDAVNVIIVKDKNYLEGWNTDGIGFHRHLTMDLKFNPLGKSVVVLGAGGAAKAIINQLARHRAKNITIYDIDNDKSLNLTAKINKEFPKCNAIASDSIEKLALKNADLLINATPIGMKGDDPCLVDPDSLHPSLLVYDLIYNPPETKILKLAKQKGAPISNGLGMLLYQGVRSFELWTGQKAPVEVMRKALREATRKCSEKY